MSAAVPNPSPSPDNVAEERAARSVHQRTASAALDAEKSRRVLEAQQFEAQAQLDALEERVRQVTLADAQVDGEKAVQTTSARLQKDLDELEDKKNRVAALNDARRAMALEASDSRAARSLDTADAIAEERHARRASVQLAIQLAEEERLRRVAEMERERLEGLAEELDERHVNQRAAGDAVERERARRLYENPLGSPFARPGQNVAQWTNDQLDEQNRQAASLLADSASREERVRQIHERVDDDLLATRTEQLDRSLNQRAVKLATEGERARRILEAEENDREEAAARRQAIASAKHAIESEQSDRIAAAQVERGEVDFENARARNEATIRALEATEQERQSQIASGTHARKASQPAIAAK